MKLNKKKILILIFILLLLIILFWKLKDNNLENKKIIETEKKTTNVENRTIETTLTAPGEVQSGNVEELFLNSNYYFSTMCVEKGDYVLKGDYILKYTNGIFVTAPYNCVITDILIPEVGAKCTSNHYIEVSSTEELFMDINIGEDQINRIAVNQDVNIVVNYDEEKVYKGKITKINAIGTKSTGGTTYAAIASLENDGNLKLGMSATCTITIEKNEELPCILIAAIYEEDSKKYVNKMVNEEIIKTEIKTGKADANYVEIIEGIDLNDQVQYEETKVTLIDEEESENALTNLFTVNQRNQRGGD